MLTLLLRKMLNTRWMVLCLLIGCVMATAMMSTIPIYMNASLQRMLTKDMEAFQLETDTYPGIYSVSKNFASGLSASKQLSTLNTMVDKTDDRFNALKAPLENKKLYITDDYLYVTNIEITTGQSASLFHMATMTGLEDHITIIDGRMYEPGKNENDAYEVIGTEYSLKSSRLTLGSTYELTNIFSPGETIKVEIVGIFDSADPTDTYWSEGLDSYSNLFLTDYDTYMNDVLKTGAVSISTASVRYSIDYHNLDMSNLDNIKNQLEEQTKAYKSESYNFSMPSQEIFGEYAERASRLRLILWLLQIPVMLMLIFYLFMVSRLNVEQEKNEISVFKSRGASSWQIVEIYALETLILGAVSAVLGPILGLGLCRVLGVSNGFLEFVNRPALPASLSFQAFAYSFIAIGVFFIATMAPIIPATKVSIVAHKQSKAKKSQKSFWEKSFLDIILIAGSVGWLYYYNYQQNVLVEQGVTDTTAAVNPIMFIASTAFILGAGLLCVRIYPLIIKLIYNLGKRFWSPAAYVSLNNIGRSSTGRERFLMVFLILTVSLGLFSANTARAVNRNAEERTRYEVGCDAKIAESWKNTNSYITQGPTQAGAPAASASDEISDEDTSTIQYQEPVFERFESLVGVESATKVFVRDNVTVRYNNDRQGQVFLMTVIPDQFAKICWTPNGLLPGHINYYLNALSEYPQGVIVSNSYREKYGVELGDEIAVKWSKNDFFTATVLAFVDYWPSINPYDKNDEGEYKDFIIMNFDYVRIQTAIEPYQVWLDLKDDASIQDFYQSITDADITATMLEVASQNIVTEKNDPMLQGMNGALTLGFIIIMIMCIIGFLIYWILSIKSRTLQFGILRAMGMSFREIIAMILYEQILVSGVAIIIAVVIGSVASDLFVPLFQSLYTAAQRVPPFKVIPVREDYLKMYAIIGGMLVIGFAVLSRIIRKININKALKLGED